MKLMMVTIKFVFSTNDEVHKEDHCDDELEKTKFNDNNETLKFVVCTLNKTCKNEWHATKKKPPNRIREV